MNIYGQNMKYSHLTLMLDEYMASAHCLDEVNV